MTTTATPRPAQPMTPLNHEKTEKHRRRLAGYTPTAAGTMQPRTTDHPEIWQAESADGHWQYQRTETPTTPWVVLYRPTGQDVLFTTLPDARRWTARDSGDFALGLLRSVALRVIARNGRTASVEVFNPGTSTADREAAAAREAARAAERLALARRAVAVLDGLLLTGRPDTRCTGAAGGCSGYLLADVAGERATWAHVDTCRECVDAPVEARRACRNLHQHQPCGDPDPVLCDHTWCSTPVLPAAGVCGQGVDDCCGCCDAE